MMQRPPRYDLQPGCPSITPPVMHYSRVSAVVQPLRQVGRPPAGQGGCMLAVVDSVPSSEVHHVRPLLQRSTLTPPARRGLCFGGRNCPSVRMAGGALPLRGARARRSPAECPGRRTSCRSTPAGCVPRVDAAPHPLPDLTHRTLNGCFMLGG